MLWRHSKSFRLAFFVCRGDKTKNHKFGIEIELTGLTRAKAADIIAEYFGAEAYHAGGAYDPYVVRDGQNRKWKVVRDGSIRCTGRNGNSESGEYSVELVSPICVYDDIETIQQLVRNLRLGGAVANSSCGIHC